MTESIYLITTEDSWLSLNAVRVIYTLYSQIIGEVVHLLEYSFKKFFLWLLILSALLWHLVKHQNHFILIKAAQKEKVVIFIFYLNTFLRTFRTYIFKGFHLQTAALTILSY